MRRRRARAVRTARAIVFAGLNRLELREIHLPDLEPDEVLVETRLTALSKGKTKYKELNETNQEKDGKTPQLAWLEWVKGKMDKAADPWEKERLQLYARLIAEYGPVKTTFQQVITPFAESAC